MPMQDAVILATETPMLDDGGDHLVLRITSNATTWTFGIAWDKSELGMHRLGLVLEEHRQKARNVLEFDRRKRKAHPPPHD